jgi:dephospho-CoA kinase
MIGSGKSFVRNCFQELGAKCFSADDLAREVIAPNTDGLRQVVEAFGSSILLENGELNRQALATQIFSSPEKRQLLEQIIHPRVRSRELELLQENSHHPLVVFEIPLLFETQAEELFDVVVMVTCDEAIRHERLMNSRGFSLQEIRDREAAQWTEPQKTALADFVINNSWSREETRNQVASLTQHLVSTED